jgi:lambda repressor-like predicted transcriptional regulator
MVTTRDDRQNRARDAVRAEMLSREWGPTELAREAGVDVDTVSTFLDGETWPRPKTQARIERAIGWPPATIGKIERTGIVPELRASRSEVDLIRETAERLPAQQRAELLAYAEFLADRGRRSGSSVESG